MLKGGHNRTLTLLLLSLLTLSMLAELQIQTVKAEGEAIYSSKISGASLSTYTDIQMSYGYYTQNSMPTLTSTTCSKPVLANGHRYLFTCNGWGGSGTSAITAYSCDVNWKRNGTLATTAATTYQDFYVYYFPTVFPDLIILSGMDKPGANQAAFIGAFNITSNAYQSFTTVSNTLATYFTGIQYSPVTGKFYIEVLWGSLWTSNIIPQATPANLFIPANWDTSAVYDGTNTVSDMRMCYLPADDCIYLLYSTNDYAHGIIRRWNLTANTFTEVFRTTYSVALGYAGYYVHANDTTLFPSFPDATHGYVYRYYYSNDGNTFTEFANRTIVEPASPGLERHGIIIPLPDNHVLIGSVGDGNETSHYDLTSTATGTTIESYTTNSHCMMNSPHGYAEAVFDQNNTSIIMGGEGLTTSGGRLTVLTLGLQYKSKTDFSDVIFTKADKTTPLPFRLVTKIDSSFAHWTIDTSSITGNNGFFVKWGNSSQTSLSNPSVINPAYTLYDFEAPNNNLDAWTIQAGTAAINSTAPLSGVYSASYQTTISSQDDTAITIPDTRTNYTLTVSVKGAPFGTTGLNPEFIIYLRYADSTNFLRAWVYWSGARMYVKLDKKVSGTYTVISDVSTGLSKFTSNTKYTFAITDTGSAVTCAISGGATWSGTVVASYSLATASTTKGIGYLTGGNNVLYFDDFSVIDSSTSLTSIRNLGIQYDTTTFTITPSADEHSTINPSTPQSVTTGSSITFDYSADTGYHVAYVLVDGENVSLVTHPSSYTFENSVVASHTIAVYSAINQYQIIASHDDYCIITPEGLSLYNYGDTPSYSFSAQPDYHLAQVLVDDAPISLTSPYQFPALDGNHTIVVSSEADPTPTSTPTPTPTEEPTTPEPSASPTPTGSVPGPVIGNGKHHTTTEPTPTSKYSPFIITIYTPLIIGAVAIAALVVVFLLLKKK